MISGTKTPDLLLDIRLNKKDKREERKNKSLLYAFNWRLSPSQLEIKSIEMQVPEISNMTRNEFQWVSQQNSK